MPSSIDIQKAAQRIREGTDILSAIAKVKKATHEAIATGKTEKLEAAGYKVFPFNASAL